MTREVAEIPVSSNEPASTWQWQLTPIGDGRRTRLVSRQRYSYPPLQSLLWHVLDPVDFVMERRMLHGIKSRAEANPETVDAAV